MPVPDVKAKAVGGADVASRVFSIGSWSLGDAIGGVTVAATSLPQYVAYAELAGLAGHQGLKTSGAPIIAFAFLTSSPSLCIGVTSITALMSHSMLNGAEYRDAHGDDRWQDLLGTWAALVGIASLVLAACGATKLAKRLPASVKLGWKLGFAVTVVAAQTAGAVYSTGNSVKRLCALPSLSGAPIAGGAAAMYRLAWMAAHPVSWDPGPVALSGLTLFVLLGCGGFLKRVLRLPGVEVVVACVLGTVLAVHLGYQGSVVGVPPVAPPGTEASGGIWSWVRLWPWEMPWVELFERLGGVHWAVLNAVAFACVDFLAILSVVPSGPASDLFGQGFACVVSGMVGAAPIGGSLSRSLVAQLTGCTSPLMGLISGVTTLILAFPQVGALLAPMPKSVLAAVVLAAVLPGVVRPKEVLRLRGREAVVAWVTVAASCLTDPTTGFGVGLAAHALLSTVIRSKKVDDAKSA